MHCATLYVFTYMIQAPRVPGHWNQATAVSEQALQPVDHPQRQLLTASIDLMMTYM